MSVFSPSGKRRPFQLLPACKVLRLKTTLRSISIFCPLRSAAVAYLCRQGECRGAASWNDNLLRMKSHTPLCLRPQPPDEGFSANGHVDLGWDVLVLSKSEKISRCSDPWTSNVCPHNKRGMSAGGLRSYPDRNPSHISHYSEMFSSKHGKGRNVTIVT